MDSWFRTRRKPRRVGPSLEKLEDRALMSTTPVLHSFPYPVGYEPEQIRGAYGMSAIHVGRAPVNGGGQTIAIVVAGNDPMLLHDVNAFDKAFAIGPSGPTLFKKYGAARAFLTVFNQNGKSINPHHATSPATGPPQPTTKSPVREESLDAEWAHAIAPGAQIDVIECRSASRRDRYAGVKTAAQLPGVSVVSISFDGAEFSGEGAYDSLFSAPAGHRPITFVAPSGDGGSPGGYPAYSPDVVAVGGTALSISADNAYGSEVAWSKSGGGTSQYELEPAYQRTVQNTGKRTIPDVAFDAAPKTGVAVYDSYDDPADPWYQVGGTSVGSPCWAGMIALADQIRAAKGRQSLDGATQTLPALYALPKRDFHDITQGSNGGFTAGAGYDEVTGLGSPIADLLVLDLAAYGLPKRASRST
jgi:subtilase family serine protease